MANQNQVKSRKRNSRGSTKLSPQREDAIQRVFKNSDSKTSIPKAGEKDLKWVYQGNNKGFYFVPNPYPIKREVNGKIITDKVFYSEGLNQIYLSDIKRDMDEIPRKTPVLMKNSILHTPASNPELQEFMIAIAYHSDKKGSIKLEDQEADALAEEAREELIESNMDTVKSMSDLERKALASDLGIGYDNSTPALAIKNRIRKYNRENPENVFNKLKDPNIHVRFSARIAVEKGFIDKSGDNLVWTSTNKVMAKAPVNGVDYGTHIANLLSEDSSFKGEWLSLIDKAIS